MKTPVAAAISITAVLVAGSAAALVNSEVFDSTPNESGASAAILPPASTIAIDVPDPTTPPTTAPDATVVTSTTIASSPTTTDGAGGAASGMLTAFEVGDAGVVTVDLIAGRLVLVSTDPAPGWEVIEESDDSDGDGDDVEVTFRSGSVIVSFEAEYEDGEIVPRVESERIGGSAPAPSNSVPSNSVPGNTVPTNTAGSVAPVTIDDDDDDFDDDGFDDDDDHDFDDDDDDDDDFDDDDFDDDDDDDEDEPDDDD